MTVEWKPDEVISLRMSNEIDARGGAEADRRMQEMLATELDDPEIELEPRGPGQWKMLQNVILDDTELDSPFLFCLSREPCDQIRMGKTTDCIA